MGVQVYPSYAPTRNELDMEKNGIEVRRSTIKKAGRGVFAKRAFTRGQRLGIYRGVVLKDWTDGTYVLGLGHGGIDGNNEHSNWTSYINDAYGTTNRTNCYFHNSEIVASRNIQKGEELFIPYGAQYWKSKKK